ncbi:MAG: fumarylacetoacetate hydrolase family protein [Bacteroidia bacterium]|nr:fumarylacetoacetate hydrolase family protein [Bacteroidia bacterium]
MKLVSYLVEKNALLGIYIAGKIWPLQALDPTLPDNMHDFLTGGELIIAKALKLDAMLKEGHDLGSPVLETEVTLMAPVPYPTSCRDGYAFRQHVAAARRNRGVPMIPEFDEYPIFYFTNHNSIIGPGDIICMPDHFQKLDFELEAAIVIGKKGRNIKAEDADAYIAGYMIMNDMSARTLQMEEMLLNLGPAKGKDFSTVIGPYFVTPDELEPYRIAPKKGHTGNSYDLNMKCWVNGVLVSEGSVGDMDWTFAEIVERCAYGTDIWPGDVIGSGTVGTGCFLELNGTGLLNNKDYKPQWLLDGDVVEMEITGLGRLINTIKKDPSDFSILALKKHLATPIPSGQ